MATSKMKIYSWKLSGNVLEYSDNDCRSHKKLWKNQHEFKFTNLNKIYQVHAG